MTLWGVRSAQHEAFFTHRHSHWTFIENVMGNQKAPLFMGTIILLTLYNKWHLLNHFWLILSLFFFEILTVHCCIKKWLLIIILPTWVNSFSFLVLSVAFIPITVAPISWILIKSYEKVTDTKKTLINHLCLCFRHRA